MNNFKNHYENHIIQKVRNELFGRYRMNEEWCHIEQLIRDSLRKITIPYMDFSITTNCTLKCKDCSQWLPYLKNRRTYSYDEIVEWTYNVFNVIEECVFITILGGEPFLHPQILDILRLFVNYRNDGRILYLRIVTNGTVLPTDETLRFCAENQIYILISDYSKVLNDNMKENRRKLFDKMNEYACSYYYWEGTEWIDLGIPSKNYSVLLNGMEENERENRFNGCFVRDCVSFFEGKLYRCPRCYILTNNEWSDLNENEVIDFNVALKSDREFMKKIFKFYNLTSLKACSLCNGVEERQEIEAAIQIKSDFYE